MNALESSIWMVYDTALAASFQSNVIGCGCEEASNGDTSTGASGTAGGAGGVEPLASMSSFVMKASPQKICRSPFQIRSNAPTVAGKSCENVLPVT